MDTTINHYITKDGFKLEYSIKGAGLPLMIMHGGHSNCREELGYRELLIEQGYSIITPSRPGYGHTSIELGENLNTACEAYFELLDHMQIQQVHLMAISAGGPSGIHFAAQYPQRVRSMILLSAVTGKWLTPEDKLYQIARILFKSPTEKYVWSMMRVMNQLFPGLLMSQMIPSFSKLSPTEVRQQFNEDDRKRFKQLMSRQRSGHGFMIDLEQTGQNLTSDLSAIACPALIIHSIHDASVPVEHARHAKKHIPNARLCELDSWGHLIWLGAGADRMNRDLFSFLGNH